MKFLLICFVILATFEDCAYSQLQKSSLFKRVEVPENITGKLENAYNKNAYNVNAGKNVFNLLNRKDFVFKNGIFSFQGQGPHFPKRIFIYNKGDIFIFENEGAFNPRGFIIEYAVCVEKLNLTGEQVVKYTKAISDYLEQEQGNTYGSEIIKIGSNNEKKP